MTYTTVIPGLPGGALVTDYPVSTDLIIPKSQTINRPGNKARLPRRSVQHGNGNPGALARADAIWAYNGARNDRGQPTQTSFHATGDHLGVHMLIPADEITWQAADGGGPGNYNGFSYELSEFAPLWNNPTNRERAISIAADFMGRVAGARLGAAKPEQHWDFNAGSADRHDCPNKLRHTPGAWDRYVAQWHKSKADELKRMNPVPAQPQASPIWWTPGAIGPQRREHDGAIALALLGEVTAKRTVPVRKDADSKSPIIGHIEQGKRAKIVGTYRGKNRWNFVEVEPGVYGRALWSAFAERFPTL